MIEIKVFTFSPVQENTYILFNENGHALIIDPGCYFTNEQEAILSFLKEKQLKAFQLLNTHCHLDHVFGNKWVNTTLGLELFIHPEEEVMLGMAPISGEKWGLPFENYDGPLHYLHEGDIVKLDDDELKVIHIPGHSPGSIGFYNAKQHFIISGDALFQRSVGRTDLPGASTETLASSIHNKLFVLPDETIVYCGHGPSTTIGYEKENNPYVGRV